MADELILLPEYAKGLSDPIASGMIETLPATSDFLEVTPFKTITQGVNRFYRETSNPAVALRGLNEEPEISYGTQEAFQDIVSPVSGLLKNDRVTLARYGERRRAMDMEGQMKAAARLVTDLMITGDHSTDPREWNGLKVRCTADATGSVNGTVDKSRLIVNSTASGGAALSLGMVDIAINQVADCNYILAPRRMKARLETAARNPSLINNRITNDMDTQLGRRVLRFGDAVFLFGYKVNNGAEFLPFNEVAHGGGSAVTTSMYFLSIREDGVCGIQTFAPQYEHGDTEKLTNRMDLFEWDVGLTVEDEFAALRLSSIADAAIVA